MKEIINHMLQLLYPRRCPGCDRILKKEEKILCDSCIKSIKMLKGNRCLFCGRPMRSRFETTCAQCLEKKHSFEESLAPFSYSGSIQDSLLRFKYHGRAEYAAFYARCIWEYGKTRISKWDADVIVPVPVHRSRFEKRGYNQAALIAGELSTLSGISVREDLVRRKKKTKAQKELGAAQRKKNMEQAFEYSGKGDAPKKILLVDDIMTTGSTADTLSELLKENGAQKVYLVCAALS